jgi:di/tricarboxylate transporter
MDPPLDWLQWFAVSLPVGIVSLLLIWLLLMAAYKPGVAPDGEPLLIKEIRPLKDKFTGQQYWVTFVCLFTIALWCIEHEIEQYVGDMGVIAIIPIVALFSTGVLKKVSSCFTRGLFIHKKSGGFRTVLVDSGIPRHGRYCTGESCDFEWLAANP